MGKINADVANNIANKFPLGKKHNSKNNKHDETERNIIHGKYKILK